MGSNSDRSPLYDVRKPATHTHQDMAAKRCFADECCVGSAPSQWQPVFAKWLRRAPRSALRLLRKWYQRHPKRGRATRSPKGEAWWSLSGSNRRPHACKARALPAELWPLSQNSQPSCWHIANRSSQSERRMVGLGRFELPTSRLSSARSNQLSY